jgi:hypothetical protein
VFRDLRNDPHAWAAFEKLAKRGYKQACLSVSGIRFLIDYVFGTTGRHGKESGKASAASGRLCAKSKQR